MKKCLSLILALCLLLAVCPAALASIDQDRDGNHIRTTVTGGALTLELWGPWNDDILDYPLLRDIQIPHASSLMTARVQLQPDEEVQRIAFKASAIEFAFHQDDLAAYGITASQQAEIIDDIRQEPNFYYRNDEHDWQKFLHFILFDQDALLKEYEVTFPMEMSAQYTGSNSGGAARYFLPAARAAEQVVVAITPSVRYRFFIANGPEIVGTEYNAEQGKLYDTLREQGSGEDWSVTFKGAADQLPKIVFGGSELSKDEDYSMENVGGNLQLTLKGSFLKNLPAGYHKIELSFSSSNELFKTALLINVVSEQPAVPAPSVPTTGDNTQLLLWSALLCASLGVSVWMFGRSRKKATR